MIPSLSLLQRTTFEFIKWENVIFGILLYVHSNTVGNQNGSFRRKYAFLLVGKRFLTEENGEGEI